MSDEMQLLTRLSEALDMSKGSLEPSNAELLNQIAMLKRRKASKSVEKV